MYKYLKIFFVAILAYLTLPAPEPVEARYGYRSMSTYRAPVYRSNNNFHRQQTYRNNQIRNNQLRAAQTQRMKTMRIQQQRQQKLMRDRQIKMQSQMKARQLKATQQRKIMMDKQRKLMLNKQKKMQAQFRQKAQSQTLAKNQKIFEQRYLLKQQRKLKERAERLRRLKLDKKQRDQQRRNSEDSARAMTSLAALSLPKSVTPRSIGQFKQQFKSSSLHRPLVNKTQRDQLKHKLSTSLKTSAGGGGNKQPPNGKISSAGSGKEPPKKLTPIFNKAAKSFSSCPRGQCASTAQEKDKYGNLISRNPKSIQDRMALQAAKRGEGIVKIENLSDPRYNGMKKMEYELVSTGGKKTVVHYVKDKYGNTMDFKFKRHSTDYIHKYEKEREAGIRKKRK